MKKRMAIVAILTCILCVAGCDNKSMNYIINNKPNVTGIVEEIYEDYIIMYSESAAGYPNGSRWSVSLNVENKDSYTDLVVGDEIVMYYDGMAMETDPLQVGKVYAITLKTPADRENSNRYEWGVVLEVQNVTPSGLTIVCNQSGGENVSELSTGSFYVIQKLEEAGWTDLEYLPQEYDIAWNSIAYIIQKEGTTTWDVNWKWLYGVLPAGKYRIGKEIMNFRATGDYDVEMLYAEFACGID